LQFRIFLIASIFEVSVKLKVTCLVRMSSPAPTQSSCGTVDPADVNISTTKDGAAAQTTTAASAAIHKRGDEQGPSTSSGAEHPRRQLDGPGSSSASEALRRPRKSLPFLPRTTQYERHPLLQMRSTATGLSEFELLMLERDADERPRRMSVEASSTSQSSGRGAGGRPALVPRIAQREVHPLFVRSADSGVCELEEYLKEISQLTPPARKSSATLHGRSSVPSQLPPPTSTSPTDGDSKPPATRMKLEPRTSQCERHALLEIKDESGLSELERLLMEKNEAAEAAEARRCTVCGAEAALRCDCARRTVNADHFRSVSETASAAGFSSSDSAQQKRVRFMQQRQKTEPEDTTAAAAAAAAHIERTLSDSTAAAGVALPLSCKANSVDSSTAAKKSNKSRSSKGRGAAVRADSTPTGVGTGAAAHRKSCCVS